MKTKPIQNELDYLVSEAQVETDIAKGILERIRKKGDYYEEKLALKMVAFYQWEERLLTLYAEAKTHFPMLAGLMENKRPYLKEQLTEAKKLMEKNVPTKTK